MRRLSDLTSGQAASGDIVMHVDIDTVGCVECALFTSESVRGRLSQPLRFPSTHPSPSSHSESFNAIPHSRKSEQRAGVLQLGVCELDTGIQGEESLSSSHRGGVGESAVQVPLTE